MVLQCRILSEFLTEFYELFSHIYFLGIDGAEDHVLSVWQWDSNTEKAPLVGRVATRADSIKGAAFHPLGTIVILRKPFLGERGVIKGLFFLTFST